MLDQSVAGVILGDISDISDIREEMLKWHPKYAKASDLS